jgi:uncharacterized membrane protein
MVAGADIRTSPQGRTENPRVGSSILPLAIAGMTTSRLETFADGVFAIAATLLILNVDAQVGAAPPNLGAGLLHMWPSYVAYVVSFLTIGIIWVNHHTVMTQVARADRTFLFLTVVFLLCVAFIPFPTRLVAEHVRDEGARAAALTYGITLTATAVMFQAIWLYAALGRRLLRADADDRLVRGITRSYLPGPFIYLAATLIALVSPTASVVLYGAIALFYVAESSLFGGSRGPGARSG